MRLAYASMMQMLAAQQSAEKCLLAETGLNLSAKSR